MRKYVESVRLPGTALTPTPRSTPVPMLTHQRQVVPYRVRRRFWKLDARFIQPYLDTGEFIRYVTRLHWCTAVKALVQSPLSVLVAATLMWFMSAVVPGVWQIQAALIGGALVHHSYLVFQVVRWRVNVVAVTNHRLQHFYGVTTVDVDSTHLRRITNHKVQRTMLGRLLGYGHLQIRSGGLHDDESELTWIRFVPDPTALSRALLTY